MDVVVQRTVLQFLTTIRDNGSSVILITHDMAVAAEICDRLAVMYAGKLLEVGRVGEVFKDPRHPYTKALIDATPSLLSRRKLTALKGLPPSLINPPRGCLFRERCSEYDPRKCTQDEPVLQYISGFVDPSNPRMVACHLYRG